MSLFASLLGQITPGTSVPQNTGTPGSDTSAIGTLLAGNNKDLLNLLKEYFQDSPTLVEKEGVIGFDISGLTADQIAALQTALQNSLDDLFGGALQLSLNSGVLGIETTGLSDSDLSVLKALLEGINRLGTSLTKEQKEIVAAGIAGILAAPSLVIVKDAGGTHINLASGSGGKVEIPPPSTPQPEPSRFAYLAGLLAVQSGQLTIKSIQTTDDILGILQQDQANQLMNDLIKAAQDAQKNAEKAQISKIFGWVTSIILLIVGLIVTVVGAVLAWTGAGVGLAALGVGLVVGGVIGCILASDVGDKITTALTSALEKDGLSKKDAAILATVIIVVATIIVTVVASAGVGAAGAIANAIKSVATGAVEAGIEGAEIAVETTTETISEGAGAAAEGVGAAIEGASTFGKNAVNLVRLIKALLTVFTVEVALTQTGLNLAQGAVELQLGDAEKAYLRDTASAKQLASTINLLLKDLQGLLDFVNNGVANAAGTIGETTSFASFATARGTA